MAELLDYLGSAEFFGILLMSGGTCFLLIPSFYSWFAGNPRRFWRTQLKYEDSDTQSLVRTTWIGGLVLFTIGAVVSSVNDPHNSEGIVWVILEIAYLFIVTWLLVKTILLAAIIVSTIWNWAVHGTPLLKKAETQKGEA